MGVARLLGALQVAGGAVEREDGLRDARARVDVQQQRPKSREHVRRGGAGVSKKSWHGEQGVTGEA